MCPQGRVCPLNGAASVTLTHHCHQVTTHIDPMNTGCPVAVLTSRRRAATDNAGRLRTAVWDVFQSSRRQDHAVSPWPVVAALPPAWAQYCARRLKQDANEACLTVMQELECPLLQLRVERSRACEGCNHREVNVATDVGLSLALPPTGVTGPRGPPTLDLCLEHYFGRERIVYACPQCGQVCRIACLCASACGCHGHLWPDRP